MNYSRWLLFRPELGYDGLVPVRALLFLQWQTTKVVEASIMRFIMAVKRHKDKGKEEKGRIVLVIGCNGIAGGQSPSPLVLFH